MYTYYGTYRSIEKEFLTYLSGLHIGPQRPVLVLCPSGRMAEYLRRKLVTRNGIISNLFFVTFTDLMEQLDREANPAQLPVLPNDHFRDYLLKNTLLKPGLNRYPISRGFVTAVKSSLQDLADGLADERVLEEYISTVTDPILEAEQTHWKWLIEVYRSYEEKMEQIAGFRSYRQHFEQVLTQVPHSNWLKRFAEIIVYGFYDLTGRQLELFQSLQTHYPVSIFWVYTSAPAFLFGKKFFETNLLRNKAQRVALPNGTEPTAAKGVVNCLFADQTSDTDAICWISAPHPRGELFFVAKEIVRLHEEEQIDFADMAVVARDLSAYQNEIPSLFHQNAIALRARFSQRLTYFPLGIFIFNLFSLLCRGFDRDDLLAVVGSPYFKIKNNWRYLIAESLAKRDYQQWLDLVSPGLKNYDPSFLSWLQHIKEQLEYLEQPLDWDVLRQAAVQLVQDYTDVATFSKQEQRVWQQLQHILQGFARYQTSGQKAGTAEFIDELLTALQNSTLPCVYEDARAVTVADVSALRGQSFKVVFLLGMNEKIFPQIIREDPVLKDYYRHILRDQLGFWMNQKMERFEEEKLLFYAMVEAAQEKLYVSYLRADAQGKAMVPSSYVVELARACGKDLQSVPTISVHAQLMQRLQQISPTCWTAKEMSLALSAQGASVAQYKQAGFDSPEIEDIMEAARDLMSVGALNRRDGMIESGTNIWNKENAKGFSPSALQDLAHCPMKYFFSKGVGLTEADDALSRSELAPNLKGTAYHEVLKDYYQHLYQEGLVGQLFDTALAARMEQSLYKHYTKQSYKQFGIYPVIWELLLQDMQSTLIDFVQQDAQQVGEFVPQIFETYFEKIYQPTPALKMKLKGIIDRIDINEKQKTFRIIDYKSSRHGGKDLTVEMFKSVILQPFIYLILAQATPATRGFAPDGATLLTIQKGYFRQELSQAGFEQIQQRAIGFFEFLMQLVRQGNFFIHPSDHCLYCPYASICRKDAFRSLLRTKHTSKVQALEEQTA